jgi:hypothetical protein
MDADSIVDVVVMVTDREPPLRLSYAWDQVKDFPMRLFMTKHLVDDAGIPFDLQVLVGSERVYKLSRTVRQEVAHMHKLSYTVACTSSTLSSPGVSGTRTM